MALKIVSSSIPLISLNILSSPPMHIEESPEAFFPQSVVSRHCSLFFPSCQFSNQQRTEIRNPVIRFLRLYIKPEILPSTAAPAELCQSFNAVHELQDLFFHSSQYTMPFKILHYFSPVGYIILNYKSTQSVPCVLCFLHLSKGQKIICRILVADVFDDSMKSLSYSRFGNPTVMAASIHIPIMRQQGLC